MIRRDLPDFAQLWQEQVDPVELAGLQALAKTISRTAARRKLFDFAVGFFLLALVLLALLVDSVPLPNKLGYVLFILGTMAWAGWKRVRIAAAARALVADDPRAFFGAAIGNARAEFNFYTLSVCLMTPFVLVGIYLIFAARGVTSLDLILEDAFETNFVKTMVYGAVFAVLFAGVVHANIKRYRQLRRLETMRREWQEQEARDLFDQAPA